MQFSTIKRLSLCLALLTLCSCGVVKKPLQPVLEKRVQNIEIAKIEIGKVLMIQQVNPVILAMGSSGLLLDTAIVAQRAYEYRQSAGPVNELCAEMFEKSLLKALAQKRIKANAEGKRYWDYYKGAKNEKSKKIGATPRVVFKTLAFGSSSLRDHKRQPVLDMKGLLIQSMGRDNV